MCHLPSTGWSWTQGAGHKSSGSGHWLRWAQTLGPAYCPPVEENGGALPLGHGRGTICRLLNSIYPGSRLARMMSAALQDEGDPSSSALIWVLLETMVPKLGGHTAPSWRNCWKCSPRVKAEFSLEVTAGLCVHVCECACTCFTSWVWPSERPLGPYPPLGYSWLLWVTGPELKSQHSDRRGRNGPERRGQQETCGQLEPMVSTWHTCSCSSRSLPCTGSEPLSSSAQPSASPALFTMLYWQPWA